MQERTIVYVDGFNLYYGSLRKTSYKRLDLRVLFKNLLGEQHLITEIKYFTKRISGRSNNSDSPLRQKAYLTALKKDSPEVKIYYGHYLTNIIVRL